MSFIKSESDDEVYTFEPLVFAHFMDPDDNEALESVDPLVNVGASTSAEPEQPKPDESEATGPPTKRCKNLTSEEVRKRWNWWMIFRYVGTMPRAIKFSEERGLIARSKLCSRHKKPMYLDMCQGMLGSFRCRKKMCQRGTITRAKGTWFENARLPLPLIYKLMYCFVRNLRYSEAAIECHTGDAGDGALSSRTISLWYSFCRETIALYQLERAPSYESQIGGSNLVVTIDESKLVKMVTKRANELEGNWIIAMIQDSSEDLRVEMCPDDINITQNLVSIVQKHVKPGSIIRTSAWEAFNILTEYGYTHELLTPNVSIKKLMAPQVIRVGFESHWETFVKRLNKHNKADIGTLFAEYSWRRNIYLKKLEAFEELLTCIKYAYKINK